MTQNSTPPSKAFWFSKTFWLNIVAALSMAFPLVREWLATNPVPFVAAFAAVGVVLRFVTHGKISLGNDDGSMGASGGSNILPLALCLCASAIFLLPSCSSEYPLTGKISYRDPGSGAKGGLVFSPGEQPLGFLRVPLYDAETGELIGSTEISGPLAGEIQPTK